MDPSPRRRPKRQPPGGSRSDGSTGRSPVDQVGKHVAIHRKHRRLKISELARMVGVTPSMIGQIERGQSQPSVATLVALAESLDVPVAALFSQDAAAARPHRFLVRGAARSRTSAERGVLCERLTPGRAPHVDFVELVFQPGAESDPEVPRHRGTEMALALSGRLDVYVSMERHELGPGDSIHLPSGLTHRYVNPTDEVARAVTVILRPTS
jgi:transcriptional regulator with XRE-family HTH domain